MKIQFSPGSDRMKQAATVADDGKTNIGTTSANSEVSKPASRTIRILLVEHPLVSAALHLLLESRPSFSVVAETDDIAAAVAVARASAPDIIVFEPAVGNTQGVDCIPDLLAASPTSRIVILTAEDDAELHLRAMHFGANALVLKNKSPDTLFQALETVHGGEVWRHV